MPKSQQWPVIRQAAPSWAGLQRQAFKCAATAAAATAAAAAAAASAAGRGVNTPAAMDAHETSAALATGGSPRSGAAAIGRVCVVRCKSSPPGTRPQSPVRLWDPTKPRESQMRVVEQSTKSRPGCEVGGAAPAWRSRSVLHVGLPAPTPILCAPKQASNFHPLTTVSWAAPPLPVPCLLSPKTSWPITAQTTMPGVVSEVVGKIQGVLKKGEAAQPAADEVRVWGWDGGYRDPRSGQPPPAPYTDLGSRPEACHGQGTARTKG